MMQRTMATNTSGLGCDIVRRTSVSRRRTPKRTCPPCLPVGGIRLILAEVHTPRGTYPNVSWRNGGGPLIVIIGRLPGPRRQRVSRMQQQKCALAQLLVAAAPACDANQPIKRLWGTRIARPGADIVQHLFPERCCPSGRSGGNSDDKVAPFRLFFTDKPLADAGVPTTHRRIDGMIHGFLQMCGRIDAANEALRDAGTWLDGL